ncbi:MAG: hypothetical protein ACQCN6_05800 [Candidatus Bathyarchaeia archaeon]
MAVSTVKSAEMGFAEFTSTLISETLNAVVTSILTQEKQAAQLAAQAQLSAEDYAKENLTDDLVRAEILRLFPSSSGNADKSAVDAGEPYTNNNETGESPSIYNKIGYTITKGDLTGDRVNRGKTVFSTAGYNNISAAARLALAKQHLAVIQTVVSRGIPRVYVDNGQITSKLTLRFEADSTATASTTGSRIAGVGIRKIVAQPVSAARPEFLSLRADVLSEVKITFKTVVP